MNKRMLCLKSLAVASFLAAFAASNVALSAETPAADTQIEGTSQSLLNDRFMVSLGTFLLSQKTKVEIDGAGGNGTQIDTEKDLGFKDADRFRLDATWRFAEKHKIRAMYFNVAQSATHTLDRDITVGGDTTYPVNATVDSKKSTDVYELAYEYSFLRRDNYEITASAGLHVMDFGFSITGTGTVNGVPGQVHTGTAAVTAPLPVFGLRGLWALAPNWYVDAQAQYFQLKIDNIDGRVTDLRAGVTWMFAKHWGLGAGYNSFTTKVNVTRDAFDGSLKWRYSGAQVFITASF